MTSSAGQHSGSLGALVTDFVRRVTGVAHAVVVSPDGLLFAASADLSPDRAEQLASVASELMRMAGGAAECFKGGAVNQTMIEMELGYLFLVSIDDGSSLAALASPRCELGAVAYEMTIVADQLGQWLAAGVPEQLYGERGGSR
ncbi:MAG: roadblock/LC7 domain-containing protein [Actinophytocola sp.]|nr:roadblock/LC7 domain-containing protein [Actinophytocola sp.]